MINLLANEKLQQTCGSAVALDCVYEFDDGKVVNLNHATADTKDVREGPARLGRMSIVNTTGSAQTFTLKKSVKGNRTYQMTPTIDLAAGEALRWEPFIGLQLFDATGRLRIYTA